MNKRGAFSEVTTTLWLFTWLIFASIVALTMFLVVGKVYLDRDVDISDLEGEILFARVNSCLEKNNFGLNENEISGCINDPNYGIKIAKNNEEVIINKKLYDLNSLCKFKGFSCFDSVWFDNLGNMINVSLVVSDE